MAKAVFVQPAHTIEVQQVQRVQHDDQQRGAGVARRLDRVQPVQQQRVTLYKKTVRGITMFGNLCQL
ncbi:TPA: hypothetical protein QDC06_003364 [Burkholderia cepacia]|nr:hypothetical protein [Burkholderia cepacia]